MLNFAIFFIHDNLRLQMAHRSQEILRKFFSGKFSIILRTAQFREQTINYHLFPHMKIWLGM